MIYFGGNYSFTLDSCGKYMVRVGFEDYSGRLIKDSAGAYGLFIVDSACKFGLLIAGS